METEKCKSIIDNHGRNKAVLLAKTEAWKNITTNFNSNKSIGHKVHIIEFE